MGACAASISASTMNELDVCSHDSVINVLLTASSSTIILTLLPCNRHTRVTDVHALAVLLVLVLLLLLAALRGLLVLVLVLAVAAVLAVQ